MRSPAIQAFMMVALLAQIAKGTILHEQDAVGADAPVYKDKPASYWIRALKDSDVEVRRDAALAMQLIVRRSGGKAPSVETLIDGLNDEDGRVQRFCAVAAGQMGPTAKGAVPTLIRLMGDDRPDFSPRLCAYEALEKIGEPAISALVIAVKHENNLIRQQATKLLVRSVRRAVSSEQRVRRGEELIPVFTEAIRDEDGRVRMSAAEGLAELGPLARDAIPALIEALADQSPAHVYQRRLGPPPEAGPRAAKALSQFGVEAMPFLIQALKHEDPEVRAGAAGVLASIGQSAKPAEPALLAALDEDDAEVCLSAAIALSQIGANPELVVPRITQLLRRASAHPPIGDTRAASKLAESLGRFGPAAHDAIPVLIEAMDHPYGPGAAGIFALVRMGPDGLMEVINLLSREDQGRRSMAAAALSSIGPEAKPAIPELIRALNEESDVLRLRSAETLGRIGPDARDSVSALIALLKDKRPGVRYAAIVALGKIGPDAKSAVPALTEVLENDASGNVKAAAEALQKIAH